MVAYDIVKKYNRVCNNPQMLFVSKFYMRRSAEISN